MNPPPALIRLSGANSSRPPSTPIRRETVAIAATPAACWVTNPSRCCGVARGTRTCCPRAAGPRKSSWSETGPEVQALDLGERLQLADERRIPGDGAHRQAVADLRGASPTAAPPPRWRRDRGTPGWPADAGRNRSAQSSAAGKRRPRTSTLRGPPRYLRRHVHRARRLQALLDLRVDELGHLRDWQSRTAGRRDPPAPSARSGPSFCASASAISAAYFGTTMALALMQERPPLSLMAPTITST